ncbi:LamG domain-containing protein [Niabella hirudinis]|uniref:LamG domain-containing protein n=1 Tax=Niabella hirudinis TaxID=1285929 RepID=UPI003EC0334F
MKKIFYNLSGVLMLSIAFAACQKMDHPALGSYPKDADEPGGPLKFYAAFDGTSNNPQRNAVDSVRANFPSDNPLASIDGVSGKAVQGKKYKYIKYSSANDFAATAGSFTVSFWQKRGLMRTEHVFSMPSTGNGSMFLLEEGSVATPVSKLYVKDATAEKWFEWSGANAVTGLYDDQWHHLAFVYDGSSSKMTLYKDGVAHPFVSEWTGHGNVKLEAAKITALKMGAGPLEFTQAQIDAGADDWLRNSWTGAIDQFRLYNIALGAGEIKALYTGKK